MGKFEPCITMCQRTKGVNNGQTGPEEVTEATSTSKEGCGSTIDAHDIKRTKTRSNTRKETTGHPAETVRKTKKLTNTYIICSPKKTKLHDGHDSYIRNSKSFLSRTRPGAHPQGLPMNMIGTNLQGIATTPRTHPRATRRKGNNHSASESPMEISTAKISGRCASTSKTRSSSN